MCLITEQRRLLTATEDMVVYKLFEDKFYSPFRGFKYEKGKLYRTVFRLGNENCFDAIDAEYFNNTYGINWRIFIGSEFKSIGQGYHAALKRKRLYSGEKYLPKNRTIRKCIIPKGSKYYLDPTGLIVSNQILIP